MGIGIPVFREVSGRDSRVGPFVSDREGIAAILPAAPRPDQQKSAPTPRQPKEDPLPATRRLDPILHAALLATVLLTPHPATAGVEVLPEAAHTGSYGLRAEVRPACPHEDSYLVLGPVVSHQVVEACKELLVGATVQDEGELVALAGQRIAFLDGFSVAQGGRLVAGTTGAWSPSYVIDDSAAGEETARVEWFGSFDHATREPGQRVVFMATYTDTDLRARTVYESATFGGWAWVELVGEDGVLAEGERHAAGPGWHRFELYWRAGTSGVGEGAVLFGVDQQEPDRLALDALSTATIESIRLGVLDSDAEGGTVDLDDYSVERPE